MKNPFTSVNVEPLLQRAEQLERDAHAESESKKLGVLRGGTSGSVGVDGAIFGHCGRVAMLRFRGTDLPSGPDGTFYFNAGFQNEDRWAELLQAAWPGTTLREEDIPITWAVPAPDGTQVPITGRPDIVLCDEAKTPVLGIELKKVCSSYRAVQVFLANSPDTKHLVQAAHYSWRLGVQSGLTEGLPWLLAYTSDSSYDTPYYAIKKYDAGRKIAPGRQLYYCGWRDGHFCFIDPVSAALVQTEITYEGIREFYEAVPRANQTKVLTPRPTDRSCYGSGKDFDSCKYCILAAACKQHDVDHDFDNWIDNVALAIEENK